ncbi:MAG: hypothetical protein AAGG55_12570 [Pseudomonadota bacterium]
MKHIGGFFELETPGVEREHFHATALPVHTGRACLSLMIQALKPTRVYVPHYTCDAALDPFRDAGIALTFYSIDRAWLPADVPPMGPGDYLLYTNYFGLCEAQVSSLADQHGRNLLVDDTHAFFRGERPGLWSFTSARKSFGVPDGAYLYSPEELIVDLPEFTGFAIEHLELRREGHQAEGFAAFQRYEQSLDGRVLTMSEFSRNSLARVDYGAAAARRRENFQALDRELSSSNTLKFGLRESVPFCYPYLPEVPIPHDRLYKHHVYPPVLWRDVLRRESPAWEQRLTQEVLPLPIDQRYGNTEMLTVVKSLGL